jgi:hypothetical protein
MGFSSFKKIPFKERLKDTGYLIKNSFTIIGRDKDIKTPTIHMAILSSIITIFFFGSLLSFFSGYLIGLGILLLLFTIFVLTPFKFFYNIRQKADQSWIVYNTITGKDISYKDAHNHTSNHKSALRTIALIDLLIAYANTQKGNKKGMLGFAINIFFSFLNEVWDLLSHYLLPAVVIEQKSIKEVIPQIKSLKNNIPATLVGVFGIDFVGSAIASLFNGVVFGTLLVSVGIGYLIGLYTDITVISLGSFYFSWVPPLFLLFLVFLIGGIYKKIVESIKVIYFTIFYTSLSKSNNIIPELKEELTNYLLMKSEGTNSDTIKDYINQCKAKGFSDKQIKEQLISQGYKDKIKNYF